MREILHVRRLSHTPSTTIIWRAAAIMSRIRPAEPDGCTQASEDLSESRLFQQGRDDLQIANGMEIR
ncbi:MAG: hypothetical protein ACK5WE_02950 [bacterium]